MNARLIPWCLAAVGFVAVLTPFVWQGDPGHASGTLPRLVAAVTPVTRIASPPAGETHQAAPVASGSEDETPKPPMILPLPAPTQPDVDPNARPVPDDQPTVQDLPAQRVVQETAEDP